MRISLRRTVGALAAGVVFTASVGIARADDVVNNLDASVDAVAETMSLTVGGANGTTTIRIVTANGDGKNGCNLTGSTTMTAAVASSSTSVATVSPSSVTFANCGDTTTLTVTPVAQGTTTVSLTEMSNNTDATFNFAPATFTVNVGAAAPTNVAPKVTVTGVTDGASYVAGSVPAAGCSVADEDAPASFAATLSSITGPNATNGFGSQTASCSYTDTGGLSGSASATYTITDPCAGRTAPGAPTVTETNAPDAVTGWYNAASSAAKFTVSPASDAQYLTEYTTDGTHWAPYTGQVSLADDGVYTVLARRTLRASTSPTCSAIMGEASSLLTIQVDRTAPDITPGDVSDTVWRNTDRSATFAASDAGSGLLSSDDASFMLTASDESSSPSDPTTAQKTVSDVAGNGTTRRLEALIDKTVPDVNCADADSAWHATDVTIACTASDALSGLVDQDDDDAFDLATALAAGSESSNVSTDSHDVFDVAGNKATAGPVSGNMVDKKAPAISCGTADADWHADDVSIACTASDGGSGVSPSSDSSFDLTTAVAAGSETATASTASKVVKDAVGNSATAGPIAGNKIDKKGPSVVCDAADGTWHGEDVTIACTAGDGGSGLADASDASFDLTTNVASDSETSNASTDSRNVFDAVGNSSSAGPVTGNKVDKKAPVVSCGAPDTAWHGADVKIHCTASDGGSGLASSANAAFDLSTDVSSGTEVDDAMTASRNVADGVGNSTPAGPFGPNKVDRKAPTDIAFAGDITDGAQYYFGFVPANNMSCTAIDGGSGLKACTVSGYGESVGSHTLKAQAEDNVGNKDFITRTYDVGRWTLRGFFQPVDMNGVWNTVKNGSTVPLKFQVFAGSTELKDIARVASFTQSKVACTATSEDAIEEIASTGGTTLRYDTTGGQFIQNWQTPKQAGTCWIVRVTTQDGSSLSANFKLK